MTTHQEIKQQLTQLEWDMLSAIINCYDKDDNICYDQKLSQQDKGVIGSLVKKGLIYDSFEGMHRDSGYEKSNFFPSESVLDAFGLEYY